MSYLLDGGPLHLLNFVDRTGGVQESFSTLPIDELPAGTRAFGGTKPLFVLTTENTISGGEDMAYGLQAFKRASHVIGQGNETTAGAANPITEPNFLCEEEFGGGWWLAAIPTLKPVHAATGTNWEGIGVKSDIIVGKGEWEGIDDAKEVATQLAAKVLRQQKDEL
jgi:C-terminal processing protease CtpA/Prc